MISDTPAEFVGGPADGQQRILQGEPDSTIISELNDGQIIDHEYRRRRVNGIGVRLPSGRVPFDWVPTFPQTSSEEKSR